MCEKDACWLKGGDPVSNRAKRGVWTNRNCESLTTVAFLCRHLNNKGGFMEERKEMLACEIINQIPDLYMAELVQVADFIRGLKAARKFLSAT